MTSFNSKSYQLAVDEKVWASQLFSNWTPDLKTELAFSKNNTTSLRSTPVNLPEIVVLNVPGTSVATGAAVTSSTAVLFGTDYSSMGNGVISNEIAFSGNGTYTWRDFTFKTGFDHEKTDFVNLFRNGSYGRFVYNYSPTLSLANDAPLAFQRNVASVGFPGTDVSTFDQTGYFAQAKWEPNQLLNVTFGIRYDVLGQPIAPTNNPAIQTAFGMRNDGTMDGVGQFAPRLAFNYALSKERNVQLRGGLGVFLGRSPWVWMSNSYGNAGLGRGTSTFNGSTGGVPTLGQYLGGTYPDPNPLYKFDPANPLGTTSAAFAGGSVAFAKPGVKPPTNLRGNLAIDVKLPYFFGSVFTVEYIHQKVMEAFFYQNVNLVAGGQGADGRNLLPSFRQRQQQRAGSPRDLGWRHRHRQHGLHHCVPPEQHDRRRLQLRRLLAGSSPQGRLGLQSDLHPRSRHRGAARRQLDGLLELCLQRRLQPKYRRADPL